ncbi:hypothetical protein Tco_1284903 [Tanacetum coccineum]
MENQKNKAYVIARKSKNEHMGKKHDQNIHHGTTTTCSYGFIPDELCTSKQKIWILRMLIRRFDLDQLLHAFHGFIWHSFWHNFKEDGLKYPAPVSADKKRNSPLHGMTFRQIFHLPQATANNHNSFVPPPSFSNMVPFYKQVLGFTMELKIQSNFKTTGLLQPWQTLCKIFLTKCITTHVTDGNQPPLQILQMLFTKIIVSHYITIFPDISRRARDMYHNLQDDDIMKNIFNSGRHKNKVGMQIPAWMITDEMKQTENYRMYAEVFRIDVPLTQSQPTESYPTLQVSLAEHKSREEQETRENVALVDEHLASEEIEKMVNGQENIVDDSSITRNDEPNILGTRIEPRSNKESLKVEITKDKEVEIYKETPMVEITHVVIPVNVNDDNEEITDEVYKLKRMEKGKLIEETRNSLIPTPIRSPRIHTNLVSLDTEKLQELTDTPHTTSSSSSPHKKLAKTKRLLSLFKTKPTRFKRYREPSFTVTRCYGYNVCTYTSDPQLQQEIAIWLALQMKFERNTYYKPACRNSSPALFSQRIMKRSSIYAHPEGENSAKRQKTSEYEAYVSGESSSGQVVQEEQAPSTSGNQEQDDDFDFWTEHL